MLLIAVVLYAGYAVGLRKRPPLFDVIIYESFGDSIYDISSQIFD